MVLSFIYQAGLIGFGVAMLLVLISLTYLPRLGFALLRLPFDRQSIVKLNEKVFTTLGRCIRSLVPVAIAGLSLLIVIGAVVVGLLGIDLDQASLLVQIPAGILVLAAAALIILYIPIVSLTYIIDYLRGSGNSSIFSFLAAALMFLALPHFVAVFEPAVYDNGVVPLAEEFLGVEMQPSASRLSVDPQLTFCNKQLQSGSMIDTEAQNDFQYQYTVYLYDHAMRAILFDLMETYRCSLTDILHSDRDMYFSTVLAVFKIFVSALFTSLFISPLLKGARRKGASTA